MFFSDEERKKRKERYEAWHEERIKNGHESVTVYRCSLCGTLVSRDFPHKLLDEDYKVLIYSDKAIPPNVEVHECEGGGSGYLMCVGYCRKSFFEKLAPNDLKGVYQNECNEKNL